MTYTRPLRRTTLQFSQIRFTLARTFIAVALKILVLLKPDSIGMSPIFPQGPFSYEMPFFEWNGSKWNASCSQPAAPTAIYIRGAAHFGPKPLFPAANPIHRLSRIVALNPVCAQAQLSGNRPIFHPLEAARWNRRPFCRRRLDQIPLAGKTGQV